jgi:ATP-dependent RNA helicase DeaD
MQQQDRERIVDQLKNGRIHILIATDVVARGLDVPRISHVINYDLPFDSESYVHRIGRTGRAGREGEAILFASYREMRLLNRLERATEGQITPFDMPDASQLSKHRIEKTKEKLVSVAASPNLEKYAEVLAKFTEETEITTEQLAAAMLYQLQQKLPLFPQADPVDKRGERRGRDGMRNDRGDRRGREGGRERRNSGDFATYKFAVGRAQGVKPSDIVGAIANEVRINSREIGNIKLFDNHCHVELPKSLPGQGFEKLKNVTIRRHKINPSLVEGASHSSGYDSENRGKRPPRKRERFNDDRSMKTFKKKSNKPRREERSVPTFN